MSRPWTLCLGLVSFLCIAVPAMADYQLDPLIISAARTPWEGKVNAAAITVIDREEIEASGSTELSEVLRRQAGVQVQEFYGSGARVQIGMRGFGENTASNVLILVDGRRLNNSDIAAPDLSVVSLKDVQRIEIIHGGAGVLYGDQAVGGVINIITQPPGKQNLWIQSTMGSFGTQQLQAGASRQLEGGVYYRVSGERRWAENYRDNNEDNYANMFGRVGYLGERSEVFLEANRVVQELELPGGIFEDQVEDDPQQTRLPDDFDDISTQVWRLGGYGELNAHWRAEAEWTSREADGEGVLTGSPFTQTRDYRTFNPRLVGRWDRGGRNVLLTVGSDFEHNDYELTSPFGVTTSRQVVNSAYAHLVLPLARQWQLNGGWRAAWVDNRVTDSFAFPAGREFDDRVDVGELGLTYRPADAWRLFARAAQTYRFPKADELTFMDPAIDELETQKGTSLEWGAEWSGKTRYVTLNAYHLALESEIAFDPSVGFGGANSNLEGTRRLGVNLGAGWRPVQSLNLESSLAWVDAEFTEGDFDGNRIPGVAEWQANLRMDWRFASHYALGAEWIYTGDAVANGDFGNDLDKRESYQVFNVVARYERDIWQAVLRVQNLFDEEYSEYAAKAYNPFPVEETGYYPAPPRSVYLTLRLDY